MNISDFEHGKTRILAETRDALRRIGVDRHCLVFDLHGTHPHPAGATLTVTADGASVRGWFSAAEIHDSRERVERSDIRQQIAELVAGIREAIA